MIVRDYVMAGLILFIMIGCKVKQSTGNVSQTTNIKPLPNDDSNYNAERQKQQQSKDRNWFNFFDSDFVNDDEMVGQIQLIPAAGLSIMF